MAKSNNRIKRTAEVFTPLPLVNEILNELNKQDPTLFSSPSKTFLDSACGNGQFLIEVYKRKTKYNIDIALNSIYGADLMIDNVCDTIARLMFHVYYNIDIFDADGQPQKELVFDDYHDTHSIEWFRENAPTHFHRDYIFEKHKISVEFSHFNKGRAAVFSYAFNDESPTICYNIVCCNSLEYDFEFDKDLMR